MLSGLQNIENLKSQQLDLQSGLILVILFLLFWGVFTSSFSSSFTSTLWLRFFPSLFDGRCSAWTIVQVAWIHVSLKRIYLDFSVSAIFESWQKRSIWHSLDTDFCFLLLCIIFDPDARADVMIDSIILS